MCFLVWNRRLLFEVKAFSQLLHLYAVLPVCFLKWCLKLSPWRKRHKTHFSFIQLIHVNIVTDSLMLHQGFFFIKNIVIHWRDYFSHVCVITFKMGTRAINNSCCHFRVLLLSLCHCGPSSHFLNLYFEWIQHNSVNI